MRRATGWALLLCVATAGCRTGLEGPFGSTRAAKNTPVKQNSYAVGGFGNVFGNSLAADATPGLFVESVLFERPIGDPLLDRDLWLNSSAVLSPKTRTLLEENGLRVAILGGNLPRAFQKLVESNEGAVSPQGMTFGTRTEAVLPTVGSIEKCEYRVLADLTTEREAVKFLSANCGILVKPERCADGRVKLRCEPQVQHGERQDWIRPTADATGFSLQGEVPLERYSSLGFDVTLGPGEYLVIGSQAEAADSLGSAMFSVEGKGGELRQRVLVIRAGYRGDAQSDLPAVAKLRGGNSIAIEASRW